MKTIAVSHGAIILYERWTCRLTDVRVENLLQHQLEELLGHSSLIDTFLPFKFNKELLLQAGWVLHGHHLELRKEREEGSGFRRLV